MSKSGLMAAMVLLVGASTASAMTEAECEALWKRSDVNNSGYITEKNGARYYAALRTAGKPVDADRLSRSDFLNHCKAGVFTVSTIDPGAPLKGANSFTEGQARDRVLAHGLTDVGPLQKDADGIWRGPAKRDGKAVTVAVDYKGNVVAN